MKRIYISGPITGIADYKQNFNEAKKQLRKVFPDYELIDPTGFANVIENAKHEEYMALCLVALEALEPEIIYMLRGSEQSLGCQLELGWALARGIMVIEQGEEKLFYKKEINNEEISANEEECAVSDAFDILDKAADTFMSGIYKRKER